ncbi:MAG: EF-P lysine aminoacylase GenX, partial [Planctomyces sp.]|nr:EF-P lysine aminoacylase GenX [Planctomyces sp.]
VFRQHEQGTRHNTEFTLLEWYARGEDHHAQMDFVERLIRAVAALNPDDVQLADKSFDRLTYDEAFRRFVGTSVLALTGPQLRDLAAQHHVSAPPGLDEHDRDGWLNLLLAEKVEPELGKEHPQFLIDYPASQAALARIRRDDCPVAERFELYLHGIEICNGYHEESNADELTSRFERQNKIREQEGQAPLPLPELFLAATRDGYPASSGVALGLERLLMWRMKKATLPEVVAFSYDRA